LFTDAVTSSALGVAVENGAARAAPVAAAASTSESVNRTAE
jgi:hypothetical protein